MRFFIACPAYDTTQASPALLQCLLQPRDHLFRVVRVQLRPSAHASRKSSTRVPSGCVLRKSLGTMNTWTAYLILPPHHHHDARYANPQLLAPRFIGRMSPASRIALIQKHGGDPKIEDAVTRLAQLAEEQAERATPASCCNALRVTETTWPPLREVSDDMAARLTSTGHPTTHRLPDALHQGNRVERQG